MKLLERHLVSILKEAIVFSILLHSVICQVNKLIIWIIWIDAEFRTRSSKITLFEKVQASIVIEKYPHSDVKLSLVNEKGLLNVLLNDKTVMFELVLLLYGL